jgi:hypothetical protein
MSDLPVTITVQSGEIDALLESLRTLRDQMRGRLHDAKPDTPDGDYLRDGLLTTLWTIDIICTGMYASSLKRKP